MRRWYSWLLLGLAAIVVLAIAAIVALPRLVDTPRVQSLIASSASQALGRPVKFQSLSAALVPYPVARLHALEIAEDPAFGGGPFLKLDTADLRLRLGPLRNPRRAADELPRPRHRRKRSGRTQRESTCSGAKSF